MCFDDFGLTVEGVVSSLLLGLVQLADMRDKVGSGKLHPRVEDQGLMKKTLLEAQRTQGIDSLT